MKEKDKFFPNLFLVGMVAIVAIVALVLYGNGTPGGAAVNKVQVTDWVEDCTETDTANDPLVPGKVKYGRIEYVDSCNEGILQQFECGSTRSVRTLPSRECPNQLCENGACLE